MLFVLWREQRWEGAQGIRFNYKPRLLESILRCGNAESFHLTPPPFKPQRCPGSQRLPVSAPATFSMHAAPFSKSELAHEQVIFACNISILLSHKNHSVLIHSLSFFNSNVLVIASLRRWGPSFLGEKGTSVYIFTSVSDSTSNFTVLSWPRTWETNQLTEFCSLIFC